LVTRAVDGVVQAARRMALSEPGVRAVALVGSCARGTPRPDSDIDLVVLTTDHEDMCAREDWFDHFGPVELVRRRQFGDVAERRLRRSDGVEIEVGLAPVTWAGTDPVDTGTARVVGDGFSIVLDADGALAGLAAAVRDRR
jgi:predicted nucleotidyltransferase